MINWKVRFKNPVFIFQLFLAAIVPVLAYMGISYDSLTTWPKVWDVIVEAYSNPYVLGLVVMSVYTAVNDPVTKGHGDSKHALNYKEPR